MQQLKINTTLQNGKYKIEKVLGQGGFGITYLAEQTMLHRKVSIKEFFMRDLCNRDESTSMVSVPSVGSADLVARFKDKFIKEASLIASMNHHNIVSIFDIFEENGTAYYVMEYIDGGSLVDKVKQGALSENESLKYTLEIADALSYLHEQNVLHLDVKPANILLRRNGEAVLIDFGISKRYDEQGGQTSTTPVGISKGYAPMEQYNQGMQKFSPATDIYSLGATLYKLLTGQTPPEASLLLNEDEELEKPASVSFATWTAIEKAMEPKVKRRPQCIADFLSLLGKYEEKYIDEDTKETPIQQVESNEETEVILPPIEEPLIEPGIPIKTEFEVNGIKFNMVQVKGGAFDMKTDATSSSKPIQKVTLSDYWIGETQVTQALWQAVMGNNPSEFKGDNRPIEHVSWNDCQKFILRLNELTGKSFSLPTEAQWEFAAVGGTHTNHYQYSGSDIIDEVAWYAKNSDKTTHDVALKDPNELGLYDMSGNVSEWCSDWYGNYVHEAQNNPTGPNHGSFRISRGGNWGNHAEYCRSSYRYCYSPSGNGNFLGLRLAITKIENS